MHTHRLNIYLLLPLVPAKEHNPFAILCAYNVGLHACITLEALYCSRYCMPQHWAILCGIGSHITGNTTLSTSVTQHIYKLFKFTKFNFLPLLANIHVLICSCIHRPWKIQGLWCIVITIMIICKADILSEWKCCMPYLTIIKRNKLCPVK